MPPEDNDPYEPAWCTYHGTRHDCDAAEPTATVEKAVFQETQQWGTPGKVHTFYARQATWDAATDTLTLVEAMWPTAAKRQHVKLYHVATVTITDVPVSEVPRVGRDAYGAVMGATADGLKDGEL